MTFFSEAQYKTVLIFGDKADRVIETVGVTKEGHSFELGYYNGDTKPKAIINISPAVGCPVGCNFCELTDIGRPLTAKEMASQVVVMSNLAEIIDGPDLKRQPLKVNIAKTGDPVFNKNTTSAMEEILIHFPAASFKYSTSMPDTISLLDRIA